MPVVQVKGIANPISFPDDMDIDDIRNVLRQKFAQRAVSGESDILKPVSDTVSPYNPTFTERVGSGISDALTDSGIISNRYGAQNIGKNLSALAEFLPGIGDAAAGDEFGRAVAQGDNLGMGLAALGAIPIVGDAAKKGIRAFHGTPNKFDLFDIDKIGSTSDTGMFGKGFYFTDDKGLAKTYAKKGGRIIEADLDLKNPYVINSQADIPDIDVPNKTIEDLRNSDVNYSKLFTEKLQRQGYDGVIDNMTAGGKQFVVFDPKAIKQVNQ